MGVGLEIGVLDGVLGNQVDQPTKQVLKRISQAEERVGVVGALAVLKTVQEVQVAPGGVKAVRRGRTKQLQPRHAKTAAMRTDRCRASGIKRVRSQRGDVIHGFSLAHSRAPRTRWMGNMRRGGRHGLGLCWPWGPARPMFGS